MAHNRTRIQGFENGGDPGTVGSSTDPALFLDGVAGSAYSLSSTTVRTGNYALRINPSSTTTSCLISNALGTNGIPSSPNIVNAMRVRAYLRFATFPSTTCDVFGTRQTSSARELYVSVSSAGVLSLDGVASTTTISTGIWYRFEIEHDWTNSSRVLRLNGTVVKSNVTAGNKSGQIYVGNTTPSSTFDMFVEDVVIETSTDIANIDWPGEGGIYPLDFIGDGFYDTTVVAGGAGSNVPGWEVTTHPNTYLSLTHPFNAGTSLAQTADTSSPYLEAKLTCTKETCAAAGIVGTIHCVAYTIAVKAAVGTAPAYLFTYLSGTGEADLNSVTTNVGTTGYEDRCWVSQTQPFGGGAWTPAALNSLEFGVRFPATSAGILSVGLILLQVEASPATVTGGNSTILSQLGMTTGSFWNSENYSPRLRTVQITSEALQRPNEAMNVVACSVRYTPWGAGEIRASWWFDYQTTYGFTFPANPILYQTLGATTGTSTFAFGGSTMVDDDQIYTQHFVVDGSGKFFQMEFKQTGAQPLRLLALDLEVKPEGRREAYQDGVY